jgi:hypothetical protein
VPLARAGLTGTRVHLRLTHDADSYVVILGDLGFQYTVRLDCPPSRAAEDLAVLDALVASIEPIPRPQGRPTTTHCYVE